MAISHIQMSLLRGACAEEGSARIDVKIPDLLRITHEVDFSNLYSRITGSNRGQVIVLISYPKYGRVNFM